MVAYMLTTCELGEKIELLRTRMYQVAVKEGFTSDESLRLSQELDELLNVYNERNSQHVKKEANL